MNKAHFFIFFLYIFDLHNLNIEGKLRSIANPFSNLRYETVANLSKNELNSHDVSDEVDNVDKLMKNLVVSQPDEEFHEEKTKKQAEFICVKCNAKYKKQVMLKLHVQKKHPDYSWEDMAPSPKLCKACSLQFENETELKKHLLTHF